MNQRTPPHVIDPANPFGSVAAGSQQFTFIADFDHTNVELMKSVRDNVKAMAQSGVKHIMLELTEDTRSKTMLNYINKMPSLVSDKTIMAEAPSFATSNVPPEDRKLSGEYIAGILIEAKNNGMKVHFVSDHLGAAEGEHVDELIKTDGRPRDQVLAAPTQIIIDAAEKYQEARMGLGAESVRADRLVQLAGGERAAVMFGAAHFIKAKDLNEMVDEKLRQTDPSRAFTPSVVMALHGSRADAELAKNAPYADKVDPHVAYYVREKEIELTSNGSQMMAMKGASPSLQAGQGISLGSLEQMAGVLAGSRTQAPTSAVESEITKASVPAPQSKPKAVEFGI